MTADKASAPADGLVFTADDAVAELRRRYPRAFDGTDPLDAQCGLKLENARDWVLAAAMADRLTRLSADLEEARGLLNEAPVLVVNREAAKRTDDREALKYAREIHPWAVRARAFLTRTEKRHG